MKKHMFAGVQKTDGRWLTVCSRGFFSFTKKVVRDWKKVSYQHCLRMR